MLWLWKTSRQVQYLVGRLLMKLFFGEVPSVSHLRTWGCLVYPYVPKQKRSSKLASRVSQALFFGFPENTKGYRLWDLKTGEIIDRCDVKFCESMTVKAEYAELLLKKISQNDGEAIELPDPLPLCALPVNGRNMCTRDQVVELQDDETGLETQTQSTSQEAEVVEEQAQDDLLGGQTGVETERLVEAETLRKVPPALPPTR